MAGKKKQTDEIIAAKIENRSELIDGIKAIGDLQRRKSDLTNEINNQIQELQKRLADEVTDLDAEIVSLSHGIKAYMDANRKDLIPPGKKSVEFPTGSIMYRDKPHAVETQNSAKFLETVLEKNGLLEFTAKVRTKFSKVFLRMKLEMDKDAILSNELAAKVVMPGLKIESGKERFHIKPANSETEMEVA